MSTPILNLGYLPQKITQIKGEIQVLFRHTYRLLVSNGKLLQDINTHNYTVTSSIMSSTFAQNYKPVKAAYSKKHDIYFILFDDWQVYVLSANLVFSTKISVITSYPLEISFEDDSSSLYVVQSNKIEQIFMEIRRTSLQIKIALLNKLSFASTNQYFTGFSFQNSLLFLWESTSLKVYNQKYQLISDKIGITTQRNSITCLLYFQSYYYAICGAKDGRIYTWSLHNQSQPINIFETDHGIAIDQLNADKNEHQFWSSANNEISLYSISTWQCLQIYKINIHYKQLYIVNQQKIFAKWNDYIFVLARQLEQRLLYQHKSDIRCQIDGIMNPQFLFDNNSLISVEDPQKFNISYVKTKSTIIQAVFLQNSYFLLTDSSDILQLKDDQLQCVMQNNQLHNSEGALVRNQVVNIKFIETLNQGTYLFLYILQGQILILTLPNFQRSVSELNYNRCSIKFSTIYKTKTEEIYILTIDEHNCFKLLHMKDSVVQLLETLQFQVCIQKLISQQNRLFILTCKGELGLYKYVNEKFLQKQYDIDGEEYFFNDFQVNYNPNLIFGRQSQSIVILTFRKIILRLLNFDSMLLNFGFFNGALVLCLQNELSIVEDQQFQFTASQIKDQNSDLRIIGKNGFEIYQQQIVPKLNQKQQYSVKNLQQQSLQKSNNQILLHKPQIPQQQKDLQQLQSTFNSLTNYTQRGRIKQRYQQDGAKQESVLISQPQTQYSQPFRQTQKDLQWSYSGEKELKETYQLLYQPAIPQTKQKKNSLASQFMESRQKRQKFKTRRDLTMNKIVSRNIRILSLV